MSSSNSNNRRPQTAPSSGIPYGYVPAYLPGSASLVEQLDQTLLIVLRDGRHLVGVRCLKHSSGMTYCCLAVYSHVILYIIVRHWCHLISLVI